MDEATVDQQLQTLSGWERHSDRIAKAFTFDGTVTDTGVALAARIDRLTGDHQHPVGMAGP
jgi:pterin-4a-carbinolamine dehydratase